MVSKHQLNTLYSKKTVMLIEVRRVVLVPAIAVLGALGYQYHAVTHSRTSQLQTTTVRIRVLLFEDWKSTGGSDEYAATALGPGFSFLSVASDLTYGR